MTSFFSSGCMAAWNYGRTWQPVAVPSMMERGTQVHSIMEGTLTMEKAKDLWGGLVTGMAAKLFQLERSIGLVTLHRELKQVLHLTVSGEEIDFVRKVDVLGTLNGTNIVADYKTASVGWGENPAKRRSFQTPGYLLWMDELNNQLPTGIDSWPSSVLYLISPMRGPAEAVVVEPTDEDWLDFWDSLAIILRAHQWGKFPHNRGYVCKECRYHDLCYDVQGWESKFVRKAEQDESLESG